MAEREHEVKHEHAPDHRHGHEHQHDQGHEHVHGEAHDHEYKHVKVEEERGAQTVTVEDVGPARKCLTIEVPAERITKKIETNYSKLRTEAAIPGFRRGRAPQRLLEKRFGESLRDDVKAQILSECYSQAIEEKKLEVVGQPDIKDIDQIELPDSGNLTFKVEVEVSPQVELPDLAGIEIKKVKRPVIDEHVQEQIDAFRRRFGKVDQITDGALQDDDYATADVKILAGKDAGDDAAVILDQPGANVIVHGKEHDFKGHVLGIMVEDLGKHLIGKKIGDAVSVSMTGPAGHENEKIKDQPITVRIKVTGIQRMSMAEVDSLPAHLGVESVDKLKERVRQMLEDRNQRQEQSDMHEQLASYLVDKVKIDLPAGLSGRQAERNLHRMRLELAYRGMGEQEIDDAIAEERAGSQDRAKRQLAEFFILDTAAKKLNIEVTESEINGRVAMLAMQHNRRPEKLRQQMLRSGELEHLYMQLREQKTLDKILEQAKIVEVDAPPPSEDKAEGADKPAKKPRKTAGSKPAAKSKKATPKDD